MPTTVAGYGTQTLSTADQAALGLVPGTNFNAPLSVYAVGTVYSLTNTAASITFGTTSPSLTITAAGTYLIFSRANLKFNGTTYAAPDSSTIKLRRTNNTPADVTNGTSTIVLPIVTTLTGEAGAVVLSPVIYTTALTNDAIALQGSVGTTPAAGSVDVTEASIIAVRLS